MQQEERGKEEKEGRKRLGKTFSVEEVKEEDIFNITFYFIIFNNINVIHVPLSRPNRCCAC